MKLVLPIICLVTSIAAFIIAILGLLSALISGFMTLFGVFAIVIIITGFTLSVIDCGLGFSFLKSKICLASGIISAVAMMISITSFIVLIGA